MKAKQDGSKTLLCCICDRKWLAADGAARLAAALKGNKIICETCVYLEMARRHSAISNISLKKAVRNFLNGTAKLEDTDPETIWNKI
jgi:hypothetical protein